MSNLNCKQLIPTDHDGATVLMWSYSDAHSEMVGYGTVQALADAFDDSACYGDGEDHSPKDAWVITSAGPVKGILTTTRDFDRVKVTVKWLVRQPGTTRSGEVARTTAWYPIRDM